MDSSTPGFGPLQDRISKALVSTTRTTAQLCAEDLAFHRSLDPELGTTLDRETERLLSLTKNLIRIAVAGSTDEDPVQLRDADDVENNWRGVVDVIDSLLEQADTCLDEYTGVIKRASPGQEEPRDKVTHISLSMFPPRQNADWVTAIGCGTEAEQAEALICPSKSEYRKASVAVQIYCHQ